MAFLPVETISRCGQRGRFPRGVEGKFVGAQGIGGPGAKVWGGSSTLNLCHRRKVRSEVVRMKTAASFPEPADKCRGLQAGEQQTAMRSDRGITTRLLSQWVAVVWKW